MAFQKPVLYYENRARDARTGDDGTSYASCAEAVADPDDAFKVRGDIVKAADVAALSDMQGSGIVFDATKNEYRITDYNAALRRISSLGLVQGGSQITAAVVSGAYLYCACFNTGSLAAVMRIDLTDFTYKDSCSLGPTVIYATSLAVDAVNNFLYAGTYESPGRIVKINLAAFEVSASLTLATGENNINALALSGGFLYAGCGTSTGKIARVDLSTFLQSGTTVTLAGGEDDVRALVISGSYLYAGCAVSPGKICRVDLVTFLQSGTTITGAAGENNVYALATDNTYIFAGFGTTAGMVLKIAVSTFTKSGATLTFAAGEDDIRSLVVSGDALYCGLNLSPAKIKKVNITAWTLVATPVTLAAGENSAHALATDGTYVYCGLYVSPGLVARILISSFLQNGTTVILPSSQQQISAFAVSGDYLYAACYSVRTIVRISLATGSIIGSPIVLAAGEDYVQALAVSGSYLYVGCYVSPGKIVRIDLTTWAVSGATITLAGGENGAYALAISGSYLYVGCATSAGKVVRIDLTTWAVSGATIAFAAGENNVTSLAVSGIYLYAACYTTAGKIVRINMSTWAVAGPTITLAGGENLITSLFISGSYLYVGCNVTPGKVIRIDLAGWAVSGSTITLATGENAIQCMTASGNYLYVGCYVSPGKIVRIDLPAWAISGTTATLESGENTVYALVVYNAYLYVGLFTVPGLIIKIDTLPCFSLFERLQTADIGDSFTVRAGLTCAQENAQYPATFAADNFLSTAMRGPDNTEVKIRFHAPNFIENGGFEAGALTGWTAGANWSLESADELEGAYSAKFDLGASNDLSQSVTKKLKKGKTYTVLFKAASFTANPTAGAVTVQAKASGTGTNLDSDVTGYQPAITTTPTWFSVDVTPDFDTKRWYLNFDGDHTKANGATKIVIDEVYIYEKTTVDTLWVDRHNWAGRGTIVVNAWRLSPLRSTASIAGGDGVQIGSFSVDTADRFAQALTTTTLPVIELILPAVSGWIAEIGELFLTSGWQVPRYPRATDPYETNEDGLRRIGLSFSGFASSYRLAQIEYLFNKHRANEAVLVKWNADEPLLMEPKGRACKAPFDPVRIGLDLDYVEKP